MPEPKITVDANDLAVLEAFLWWCRGFHSAFQPGYCNMPNTIALDHMKDRIAKALREERRPDE